MSEISKHQMVSDSEVTPSVYRFGTRRVNWYIIEANGKLTVVDAGLPGHWQRLQDGLNDLGYSLNDIAALVLTHGHSDHIGFAERLRQATAIPVMVHEADVALAQGANDESASEVVRNLWRPAMLGLLLEFARNDGLSVPPVETVETFEDGAVLDVPGAPQVIHLPGHSDGSCALYLPDHEVLLCGDALATLDIKTGRARGPQIMSLFNTDDVRAAESLDRIESLGKITLLPGHGDPWRGETREAVRLARAQEQ